MKQLLTFMAIIICSLFSPTLFGQKEGGTTSTLPQRKDGIILKVYPLSTFLGHDVLAAEYSVHGEFQLSNYSTVKIGVGVLGNGLVVNPNDYIDRSLIDFTIRTSGFCFRANYRAYLTKSAVRMGGLYLSPGLGLSKSITKASPQNGASITLLTASANAVIGWQRVLSNRITFDFNAGVIVRSVGLLVVQSGASAEATDLYGIQPIVGIGIGYKIL